MTEDDTFNKLRRLDFHAIHRLWIKCPLEFWDSIEVENWFKAHHWDKDEWYKEWEKIIYRESE